MRTLVLLLAGLLFGFGCHGESASKSNPPSSTIFDLDPGPNETCTAWAPNPSADSISLEPLASSGWQRSVFALQHERYPSRWYIAEQRGVVSYFDAESGARGTVYDGRESVLSH